MRPSKLTLLAGTALCATLLPIAAFAQTADTALPPPVDQTTGTATATTATSSPTADAQDAAASAAPETGGEIVVLGFGQSRQVQSITAADISRLVPGSSPLKAIEKLPGVNFQSADAFGAYEWAVRISLRGFSQNQLGFTLDGIPLGDMSYGNVNGLHISRAVTSENIARTEVAQGAGAVTTASTSNLGGTIQFYTDDPRDTPDITGSATYGSDNTWRGYARLDSGLVGGIFKGYVSYMQYETDKWKGYGKQKQKQVNAKIMADLGALGSISAFFDYSDRHEQDYQDLSLDIIKRRGYNDDNITNDYALALQIARAYQNGTAFPAGFGTVDDAYYDAAGLRRDYLAGMTVNANLAPGVTLKTTGYYHVNKGQGSWITPYAVTPNGAPNADGTPITAGAPVAFRTTEYNMHRGGIITGLTYEAGSNTLTVGGWLESNDFDAARRFYGMSAAGPNRKALDYQKNPFFTQWDGNYNTDTIQYYVEDSLKLLDDALTISGGWKGMRVQNVGKLRVGTLASGKLEAKDWFLPQVGVLFKLDSNTELFADYTENMRAFVASGGAAPYSGTQLAFNAIRGTLKPETSKTVEGGLRFRANGFQASAVGYYVDFSNRLLVFQNGSGIQGIPPTLNNAGSVESYGAEISVNYRIAPPISLFASYSYNHNQYQDDVVNAATGTLIAATAGKTVVDSPKHMLKGEIVFEQDGFTARAGADYMSKRYFTYLNDQSVGDRVLVDASIGYKFQGEGVLHGVGIEGSVVNLTDKRYIATIGSNGYTNSGDNQTLLAGSPRQFFVSLKKGF